MKKFISALCALMLLVVSFSAIAEETAHGDVELVVGNTTKVNGNFFSPALGNNTSDIDVRNMLQGYNPIAWTTQLDFIADPTVVSAINKADGPEGRTYTLVINQGLTYNDGETTVNARDYVFSILMQASKEFAAVGASNGTYTSIVGYEDYAAGNTNVFSGIRLINDYSYSVTIKSEFEPYFYEMSYLSVFPYPASVIAPGCGVADDGQGAYITGPYTAELLQANLIDNYVSAPYLSAGPYKFVSYDPESGRVEFAKNEYYLGNYEGQIPSINSIALVPVLPADMLEKLDSGEVDVLNKCVDGQIIDRGLAMTGDRFNMLNYPRLGYGFCAMSCEQGPQQFQAVRQALLCSFNTEEFVLEELHGYGIPCYGYYGVGQWMYRACNGGIAPEEMTEAQAERWAANSLDQMDKYTFDLDRAKQLLIDDGWTLNADGSDFVEGTDTLRHKMVDGELMPLRLKFALCKDNDTATNVINRFLSVMPELGGELDVHEVEFVDLLRDYYREDGAREYDMNFMATNFVSVFDPYYVFSEDENNQGKVNTSGIVDQELVDLAWDLHCTEPHDLYTFLERWVKMQERFNVVLPTLPLYSNIYYDFYISELQNYYTNSEQSWPVAILYAYLGEAGEAPVEEVVEEDGVETFD